MNINNIAEQILRKMPKGLSKLEQARFVYIELGKMVSFDEEYWFGNREIKKRIYTSSQKVRDFKDLNDNKIICVSLSNLYNSLMRSIGIDARQQRDDEEDPHVYSIISIDGVNYKADLQRDLKYIQARRKTVFFDKTVYFSKEPSINSEVLRRIDEKIGYLYEGEEDLKNLIEEIESKTKSVEELEEKVKIILESLDEYQDIAQMGYIEKMAYYDSIIDRILTKRERNKIYKSEMYVDQNEKRKYTCCISVQKKDGNFYRTIYSENTGGFLPIEDEKILELMQNGLKMWGMSKIPGLKGKSKTIEQEDSKPDKDL